MKKVVVSACLLGECCKYSGGSNKSERLLELLPTPRPPAEIVNGEVINKDGVSVDAEYRAGVATVMDRLRRSIEAGEVEAAILQSRSPSCGVHQVYDGTFSGTLITGKGLFARALDDAGVRLVDVADL